MGRTSARNASVSLTGGQSDKISEAKSAVMRKVIVITNLNAAGGANCWIAVDEEAKASSGIQLAPGQSITFSKDAGYTPMQGVFNAYAAAAGTTVAIYEELEVL